MQDKLFDIITLNETRLDSSVLNGEIEIPSYDIVRRDRNRSAEVMLQSILEATYHTPFETTSFLII